MLVEARRPRSDQLRCLPMTTTSPYEACPRIHTQICAATHAHGGRCYPIITSTHIQKHQAGWLIYSRNDVDPRISNVICSVRVDPRKIISITLCPRSFVPYCPTNRRTDYHPSDAMYYDTSKAALAPAHTALPNGRGTGHRPCGLIYFSALK